MHCPLCRHELEVGTLSLRAWGSGDGRATLSFNSERLLDHAYLPVIGAFCPGPKRTAVRCPQCTFVGFVADEDRCALATDEKAAEAR